MEEQGVVSKADRVGRRAGPVAEHCRDDRRLAPLRTPLFNGQSVEVITATGAHTNPAWLNFVTTAGRVLRLAV